MGRRKYSDEYKREAVALAEGTLPNPRLHPGPPANSRRADQTCGLPERYRARPFLSTRPQNSGALRRTLRYSRVLPDDAQVATCCAVTRQPAAAKSVSSSRPQRPVAGSTPTATPAVYHADCMRNAVPSLLQGAAPSGLPS